MGYIDKNLLPNEEVIATASPHIAAFARAAIPAILGLILVYIGGFIAVVGFVFLLMGLWRLAKVGVIFLTNELAMTNKRLIGKISFLRQESVDVRLGFVSTLSVNQGILGRLLNYGNLNVKGGGNNFPFLYIKDPTTFRNTVQGYLTE